MSVKPRDVIVGQMYVLTMINRRVCVYAAQAYSVYGHMSVNSEIITETAQLPFNSLSFSISFRHCEYDYKHVSVVIIE